MCPPYHPRRCAFAEPVEGGESTELCKALARKWNMARAPAPASSFPSAVQLPRAAAVCGFVRISSDAQVRLRPLPAQVIVNPILERDESHSDVVWNTAVVISNSGRCEALLSRLAIGGRPLCPASSPHQHAAAYCAVGGEAEKFPQSACERIWISPLARHTVSSASTERTTSRESVTSTRARITWRAAVSPVASPHVIYSTPAADEAQ